MQHMAIVFDENATFDASENAASTSQEEDNISNLSVEQLKSKLEEAVRDENYELATRLRDEIKKRENNF